MFGVLLVKAFIMTNSEFAQHYKERTLNFSLDILNFYAKVQKLDETRIMGKQLIRCATSIGANFRAACVARSFNEKFAKYCIVVEEADEAIYWLLLFKRCHLNIHVPNQLIEEAEILTKVMTACKKGIGRKVGKYK